ncbi:helix-turn-helix transcriptional regulator [Agaribacter flavus]|uniref:Helix-turn-helix transcriptional regulator n=1 Tax=Agaribacter flavus TaxID=1902781 RepID=A0ABV7FLZ7_9ALTE
MSDVTLPWSEFVRAILPLIAAVIYLLTLVYFTLVRHKVQGYAYFFTFILSFSFFLIGPVINLLPFESAHRYFDIFRNLLLFSVGIPALTIGLGTFAEVQIKRRYKLLVFALGWVWSAYFILSPPLRYIVNDQFSWAFLDIAPSNIYQAQAFIIVFALALPTLVVLFNSKHKVYQPAHKRRLRWICMGTLWLSLCMCLGLLLQQWGMYYGGASISALIWAWAIYQGVYHQQLALNQRHMHQIELAKRHFSSNNADDYEGYPQGQLSQSFPFRLRKQFIDTVYEGQEEDTIDSFSAYREALTTFTQHELSAYKVCMKETIYLMVEEAIKRGKIPSELLSLLNSVSADINNLGSIEQVDETILSCANNLSYNSPAKSKESPDQLLVDHIIQYLLSNYHKNINLDQIAEEVGASRAKATKVFKKLTQLTINQYLTKVRIDKAKVLLKDHGVTETALDVGFSNPSYFTTVFKKQTGVSPTEYQQKIRVQDSRSSEQKQT